MKLTIYKASDGDCNLLSDAAGTTHLLVDGGRAGAFEDHVASALEDLHAEGKSVRAVCVSHIDDDHISGVLKLIERKVAWVRHRFQIGDSDVPNPNPNPDHAEPNFGEPPDIGEIWHNGFREVASENAGPIEDQLAAVARLAFLSGDASAQELAESLDNLITGEKSAVRLQRKLKDEHLKIKHNPRENGKIILAGDSPDDAFDLGDHLSIRIVGPTNAQLVALREEWNTWLGANQDTLANLGNRALTIVRGALASSVAGLRDRLIDLSGELGDFGGVSAPNVASIVFLAEENNQGVLMTGDAVSQHVLEGVEAAGVVQPGEGLHVNILKVPHHGAAANTDRSFAKRVTADHYVFCSNGRHHNPDEKVLAAYIDSRLGAGDALSDNDEAGNEFKLWLNYDPDVNALTDSQKEHMDAVKEIVTTRAAGSGGRMTFEFIQGDSAEIDLDA